MTDSLELISTGGDTCFVDSPGRPLRSGEVAERAGVNVETLRYYERRGLIEEPRRSLGGHRTYPADTVELVGVIKSAQRLGFTLEEISELIAAGRGGHPTPDLKERAHLKLVEVEARIADLTSIRDELLRVVDAGCDSLVGCTCADCPVPYASIARPAADECCGDCK